MKYNSQKRIRFPSSSATTHAMSAAILSLAACHAQAASVEPDEFTALMREANTGGIVRVLISLDERASLKAIKDDSGVRKDHELFKAGGVTKVLHEACFGTNSGGFVFLAPGGSSTTSITSADRASTTSTKAMRGTSQAAPHVAGLYAVVKAAYLSLYGTAVSVADATAWIATSGSIAATYSLPAPTGIQTYRRVRVPAL